LGNAAFSAGNYVEAVEHFTAAIGVDPANHVFFSNRSAAQSALEKFDAALVDAEKTVEIKPDWAKGKGTRARGGGGGPRFFCLHTIWLAHLVGYTSTNIGWRLVWRRLCFIINQDDAVKALYFSYQR
jgi:tetratricopeptide (TPR) repeat protein